MPTQQKIFTVENLTQKLKDAKSLVLTDYRGLTVAQISDLRRRLKEAGGELEVVKNRLFKIAAKQAKVELDDQVWKEPTAIIWSWEDGLEIIKSLDNFSKETGLPKLKSGLWEGQIISADQIESLAQLPGIDRLRAKLVGNLQSPIYGLVNSLSGNIRKLVFILKSARA